MKGAPGMPLGAIAQISPCLRSVPQSSGGTSSTDGTPNSRATWQVRSTLQRSPALLKHQKTIDCLMRPCKPGLTCSALAAGATREFSAEAAPAAVKPPKRWRRLKAFSGKTSGGLFMDFSSKEKLQI